MKINMLFKRKSFFNIIILFSLFLFLYIPVGKSTAFSGLGSNALVSNSQADAIFQRLTPQEKIGQLFLVTFTGTDVSNGSAIERLIREYHIGGVVLKNENDNFQDFPDIISNTVTLIDNLQNDAWNATLQEQVDPITNETFKPEYIPMWIGISQDGNGYPFDQIIHGLTPLPNLMAIGGTWDPNYAFEAGKLTGRELSSLGINLLFGPSLDVLDSNKPEVSGLGTRTFGADPFWVSEMGKSFINGLHTGSNNTLIVSAKNFPGYGGADRVPENEIATVRKSLSELKEYDLLPFYAVTGDAQSPAEQTDALLVSHIRYQGFSGTSPRSITRPLSIEQASLQSIMEIPQLNTWVQNGGILISDDLGGEAIRNYLDLDSQSFDPARITTNALLAGNDLLYVSNFSSENQPDQFNATIETMNFLERKYLEDPAFAQRIDASVLKILNLKLKLYNSFSLVDVLPPEKSIETIDTSSTIPFEIIRNSATLVNPSLADLDEVIPETPKRTDRIVFITDVRSGIQCSKCVEEPLIAVDALQNVILKRYGPDAGRLVVSSNLVSYPLSDLEGILNSRQIGTEIERRIALSHWIVFSLIDNDSEYSAYSILSRFLARRPDLLQGKKIIVFGFDAPYFLDATDISKITAIYCLYSKIPQAIDMAAYLLFQELPAIGKLPVSVEGINYNLNEALFPDPNQTFILEFDTPTSSAESDLTTPQPPLVKSIGDIIPLKTGVLLDFNGNIVPDGTPVEFIMKPVGEANSVSQIEFTKDGIARTSFIITVGSSHEFSAQSEQAKSNVLRLDVPLPLVEKPTTTPTLAPTPTVTPTITPTETPQATPIPEVKLPANPNISDWLMAILISALISWIAYRLTAQTGNARWGLRSGLLIFIFGLLSYSYLTLHLPGSEKLIVRSISQGVFFSTISGCFLGLLVAITWKKLKN
jgi:beta-N-acetylhexosaminidase